MHERSNALISFALMSAAALLTLTRWHRRTVLRLQAQKSLSLSVPTPDLRRKGFNFSGSERRSGHSRGHGAVCRLTSNERPPEGLSGTFRGKDGRSRDGGRRNEAGAGFQPDAGHPADRQSQPESARPASRRPHAVQAVLHASSGAYVQGSELQSRTWKVPEEGAVAGGCGRCEPPDDPSDQRGARLELRDGTQNWRWKRPEKAIAHDSTPQESHRARL